MCGILFAKMLSSCVPSGGKILNQDCCSPCVFHLCWGCVWLASWEGGWGGFSWGLLRFSFILRSDVIKFHLVCGLDELHSVFFLCYNSFLVSAISRVEDIALQNFNVSRASCTESWTGCLFFCSLLSWCGVFITFDLVFLYFEVFFKVDQVFFLCTSCLSFVSIDCCLLEWENIRKIIAL